MLWWWQNFRKECKTSLVWDPNQEWSICLVPYRHYSSPSVEITASSQKKPFHILWLAHVGECVCVCVYLCILLHGVLHGDVERRIVACEWNYHSREISLLSFETDHRPLEHPFLFSIAEWRHRGRSSFNDTLSSSVWISLSTVPQASGKLNKRNKIIHPSAPSLEWGTCRNKGN